MNILTPPSHWTRIENLKHRDRAVAEQWQHALQPIHVIRSISTTQDGVKWLHVSASVARCLPSWKILVKVKSEFMGTDVEAYQVLPKVKENINLAECLHLWAPLDGIRRVANMREIADEYLPEVHDQRELLNAARNLFGGELGPIFPMP